jgi:Rrf2 family protein
MQITKQADYAVRAVLELSRNGSKTRLTAEDIARRRNIPHPFLSKTLGLLAGAKIVSTQRGARGGIRLSRPSSQISLLQVVEAVDGPIALNNCTIDPDSCTFSDDCATQRVWCDLRLEFRNRLAELDFALLASSEQKTVIATA